jgi:DUF971 family protein
MAINQFLIDNANKQLSITFDDGFAACLNFEFLRVLAPSETAKQQQQANYQVLHKKSVIVNAIEAVGKHGYRLCFDDAFSDIYNEIYLKEIAHNQSTLWQEYLNKLDGKIHQRETSIEIKEVK